MAEPTATTTLADGPFRGRQVRISNSSRPFVLRDNGKAAIYLYRREGIHRFKGWCDIIDLDRKPAVPVVSIPTMSQDEMRESLDVAPARRRSRWRRFWERLFPRPVRGSDG